MERNSLGGIPASGEGPYIMGSDLEELSRVFGEVVVGIADCFNGPGGDSSWLDLLGVAWRVGYEETFPALAELLSMSEVDLDGTDTQLLASTLS